VGALGIGILLAIAAVLGLASTADPFEMRHP
jgi:hypothetical protein